MADTNSEEEPSIEEILASIRQIISDDDEEEVEEEVIESPVHEDNDDVLELTEEDLVKQEEPEPEEEAPIEIDMRDKDEEEVIDEPEEEEEMDPKDIIEEIRAQTSESANTVPSDILSNAAQSAALSSMGKLKSKMPINNARSYDGVTLEDIVREMLHPMLREWMDDNLPPMVERIVQKELEKLARRAFDD